MDADLRPFRDAGGKMIMWHGMADPLVLPGQSRRYYERAQKIAGEEGTDSFFRLFMTPGLGHCWELPAGVPDQVDWLSALERWVEKGDAPDEVEVTQFADDGSVLRRGKYLPYPNQATYSPAIQ